MRLPPFLRLVVRNFVSNMDPLSMIVRFGQPAFVVVVLGIMFSPIISSEATTGGSYMAFLVPGMVAFQMILGGVVAGNLFWLDRRWAMVEQIFSGPFLRSEYLAGLVVTTLVFSLAGAGIMLLVALPFVGLPALSLEGTAVVLATIALGSVFFSGLLIALGTQLRSANQYFTIQAVLQYFVVFLSTVYYPVTSKTPAVLAAIVYGNPLTYAVNAVRDAFAGTVGPQDLLWLGILGLLALLVFSVAAWGFRHLEPGPVQ